MDWFPIGPDFVFAPRQSAFSRLSRRNEAGRQGLVSCIAIEPADPNTIYVCVRPGSGGSSMFRTRDGGASWVAISDGLRAMSPTADPIDIAIHPVNPSIIYVGSSADQAVYISNNRGEPGSWTGPHNVGGNVLEVVVDPRGATNPATTVLYATARQSGLYRSNNGGVNWTRVLIAKPTSFVAHMPATGTAHFYVGSVEEGLWHATDPTGPWENLCNSGIGLPRFDRTTAEGNYLSPLVDLCPRAPNRVYAWFARAGVTTGLYTTSASPTSWTRVAATTIPNPWYGLYGYKFAVASNSPGDGLNDILLFGNYHVHRSIDGGRNWRSDAVGFHVDIHSFVFDPAVPPAGVVPTTYLGCDGGIAKSRTFADPAVAVETPLTDFNHGAAYSPTLAGWINLNHGMGSVAVLGYASDPNISAVSFIGCQDTGVAVGEKTLGWRSLGGDSDIRTIAAARGMLGISCWISHGSYNIWPEFRISRFSERRTSAPFSWIRFGSSFVANTANFAVGLDGKMITGMIVRDRERTVAAMIPRGVQTVTPSSMTGIRVGSRVVVEPLVEPIVVRREEIVTVTAITATTFTATFAFEHPANSRLLLERAFVGRVGEDDLAEQISQDFGDNGRQVKLVIVDPTNADVLYCVTSDGARVWTTNTAISAGPATVWVEIATNRPPLAGSTPLSSIAVDAGGTAYALWVRAIRDSTGATLTPLYRLSGGSWIAETVTGFPTTNLGKIVGDPVRPGVLYMISGNSVYRLDKVGTTWSVTDIGAGLPGAPVYDIWIANIGTPLVTKVLLRAAVTTRGIFESDVTVGAVDPPIALYVRDHLLDQAWISPTPEGMPDPYNPSATLWYYMCADVKVDMQSGGIFQTDPEGATPLSHVHFNMLRDNSRNLPQSASGKVHVMVHNRSLIPASNVRVWAVYCRASAGVPGLNVSPSRGNAFPFWDQFRADGTIVPSLPEDSPWDSVNTPVTLPDVDADRPRVATFNWTIPTLTAGDTGHYCLVVFVHSAASPVGETTNMNVESITRLNRQVGQKNLHVVAVAPGSGGGVSSSSGSEGRRREESAEAASSGVNEYVEYVEFHNPTNAVRVASLRFDFRALGPDTRITLQFTPFKSQRPPSETFTGITRSVPAPPRTKGCLEGCLWAPLRWLYGLLFGRQGEDKQKPAHRLPKFEPWIYEVEPGAEEVLVHDVVLAPFERVGALLKLESESLYVGERFINVQQIVDGQVVGGAAYSIGTPEQKRDPEVVDEHRLDEIVIDSSELERREEEAEKWRYTPPWIEPIMEQREFELGKKIDRKRRPPVEREDENNENGPPG